MNPIYKSLGLEQIEIDASSKKLLREQMIGYMCEGDSDCKNMGKLWILISTHVYLYRNNDWFKVYEKYNNTIYSIAALSRFNIWMSNGMPDDKPIKDFKATIYCLGIRYGNKTIWNLLWQKFGDSSDQKEKGIILSALGCSKDDKILKVWSNVHLKYG